MQRFVWESGSGLHGTPGGSDLYGTPGGSGLYRGVAVICTGEWQFCMGPRVAVICMGERGSHFVSGKAAVQCLRERGSHVCLRERQ